MSKPLFLVKKPGMQTTIQDKGRTGYQQFGVVASGAMDQFSYQAGNLLVGNNRGDAALEITMAGPHLLAQSDAVAVITGADLQPQLNGQPVSRWISFSIKEGDELIFHGAKKGVRAYLCISGGIAGEKTLGSQSTYMKARMGGIEGRSAVKGDTIYKNVEDRTEKPGKGLHYSFIPDYDDLSPLRVVPGPEEEDFTKDGLHAFYNTEYIVTQEADRMGMRLEGTPIKHLDKADILSDAVAYGTIQVPKNGQPMILMADRQTTGGYTRIANVISTDLPRLAQLLPGKKISFEKVSVETAHSLMKKQEKTLTQIEFLNSES
ncbi:biotin-dependent carboxyltransferase family protein [Bacillus sp. FJAT-44742]|uniref:5-oxoprolinase subunit C family protein n=1 Tax=Bacillus sp. FJAT-44742 TaxID=2014005 RepID=UPI000C2504F0|nr:biotin-dependent carboxyltransferase family protein [Bacillus sp. FJAT-44742]